jgi:methyltransferase (TIGR00027 family)
MSAQDSAIQHVSDTALMVAACRAMETERPDGFVRDPFARRLAGARGMAIAEAVPRIKIMCFGVGIRSRFFDELLTKTITEQGVTTVLSVGCGLDTRPWRLDLPRSLRWIEVDFPEMLDYKAALMAADAPRCRMEPVSADLNDPGQRRAVPCSAPRPMLRP